MASELSPQSEQYLASIVAGGLFPSKEAALEAAVEALRARNEPIPMVPAEHMDLVEKGLDSVRAGRSRVLTDADWQNLRQLAHDTASGARPSGV